MKRRLGYFQRIRMLAIRHFAAEFKIQIVRPLQRHGSAYGGWTLVPTGLDHHSIVYSFGVGDDISFDLSLIANFGCHIYAFDPTPKSIAWIGEQALPPKFHFFPYGIAAYDGMATFSPPADSGHVSYSMLGQTEYGGGRIQAPVYRLQSIMKRLRHSRLHLLKLDVEGAEYDLLSKMDFLRIPVYQILVEFHHRFASVGWQPTKKAIKSLWAQGYKTAHITPRGDEFTFLRADR